MKVAHTKRILFFLVLFGSSLMQGMQCNFASVDQQVTKIFQCVNGIIKHKICLILDLELSILEIISHLSCSGAECTISGLDNVTSQLDIIESLIENINASFCCDLQPVIDRISISDVLILSAIDQISCSAAECTISGLDGLISRLDIIESLIENINVSASCDLQPVIVEISESTELLCSKLEVIESLIENINVSTSCDLQPVIDEISISTEFLCSKIENIDRLISINDELILSAIDATCSFSCNLQPVIDEISESTELLCSKLEVIESLVENLNVSLSCDLQPVIDEISESTAFLCSKLDLLITDTLNCQRTAITNANTTISQEGSYCVTEPINGTIAINASNVDLDLNGYEIGSGITIGSPIGVNEIKVANGTVLPSGSNVGLLVNDSNNVLLENILATGGGVTGIDIANSHDVQVLNCRSTNNEVGLRATDSYKVNVSDTTASCNSRIGFELASSYTNCFENCKALSSGFNNSTAFDAEIFGFVSNNGFGNIFERCVANGTQALSTTDSNSLIAGFALRGSEHCSKIIDSESANAKTSTGGVTIPFGIVLEGTIDSIQAITGALEDDGTVAALSWSPDGQYIAIGGSSLSNSNELQVFRFDRVRKNLQFVTGALGTQGTVDTVSWSPDGNYIAVGGNNLSGDEEFQVFRFDHVNETLQFVSGALGVAGIVSSVIWSPDGQYIAVSGTSVSGDLQVFRFDRVSESLQFVAGTDFTGNGNSVSWSPDGQYVVVGVGSGVGTQVFRFDRATESLQFVDGVSTSFNSVSWSPDGHYIAGGFFGVGNTLQVFRFDYATESLQLVDNDGLTSGGVLTVSWSPDGNYIVVGGGSLIGSNELQVFRFDRASENLQFVAGALGPDGSVTTALWSPDGNYIAVGLSSLSGNNNEFQMLSGIQFPMKNVITNNIVYCNGNDLTITATTGQTFASSGGVGISGSSVANMIIGNTAYNNPPSSDNFIVGSNYQFVTNVFNQKFGQAPSALQNISLDGCDPISTPEDLALLIKQIKYKVCISIPSQLDVIQSLIENIDASASCDLQPVIEAISESDVFICSKLENIETLISTNDTLILSALDAISSSTSTCNLDPVLEAISESDAMLCTKIGTLDAEGTCLPAMITVPEDINDLNLNVISLLKTILLELRGCTS